MVRQSAFSLARELLSYFSYYRKSERLAAPESVPKLKERFFAYVLDRFACRMHEVLQTAFLGGGKVRDNALDEGARDDKLDVLEEVNLKFIVGHARDGILFKVECEKRLPFARQFTAWSLRQHQERREATLLVREIAQLQVLQATNNLEQREKPCQ